MDEQITQLDRRLISVEKDVAALTVEAEHARLHYATKEDFARLEGRVANIQDNYATKEDVAEVRQEIVASELRTSRQLAAMDGNFRDQLAATDSKLSAQIAALEGKVLSMENRQLRWIVGTVVAVAGIVLAIVRTFP